METESETGSRNAPNIPPKIVQTTARAIISGLHNFQNIFSVVKSYVVQHGFVFDWIRVSIAHLFGIEKRKRNSGFPLFLLYIREQNYKPGSVFDSHLSKRAVAGALQPPRERTGRPIAPIPVLLRIEFTASDTLEPTGALLPHLSTFSHIAMGSLFLLHFSSDRSGRALPVILALRSPDFPHARPFGAVPATVRPGRRIILLYYAAIVKQIEFIFRSIYNRTTTWKRRICYERPCGRLF